MTAFLVAIEGGDGVGKNTIARGVAERLSEIGKKVKVIDFPRYSDTLAGSALTQFLNGNAKRPVSAKVASVLYALDRLEFKSEIDLAVMENDYLIFDRYIASNVAYQSAKVVPEDRIGLMAWIANLELEVFGLPAPDLNVLLRLDVATARDLVSKKPRRDYTGLVHDIHEADDKLQERLRANYEHLVASKMISNWLAIDVAIEGVLLPPVSICEKLVKFLLPLNGDGPR